MSEFIGKQVVITREPPTYDNTGHRFVGLSAEIFRIDDKGGFIATASDGRQVRLEREYFMLMDEFAHHAAGGPVGVMAHDFAAGEDQGLYVMADQAGQVIASITPAKALHFGPGIVIDYSESPPVVKLDGCPPDVAARAFWNAVHAVIGRAPLFPDDGPISKEEMVATFGEEFPPDVIRLIYDQPDAVTIGETRRKIRELGRRRAR